jgi:cob(I)alamin adenosyltransferase
MKIYTKKGDKGETSLIGGDRVKKSHERLHAYGTVDELNSYVGLLRDHIEEENIQTELLEIQDRLFTLGSQLAATPDSKVNLPALNISDIEALEKSIDSMNESLPEMRSFVLPGGHKTVSLCHVARTICRRAERWAIAIDQDEISNDLIVAYLNRLSDYFFMLSRYMSKILKVSENPWKPRK